MTADELKALRAQLGLTQQELADRIGYTQPTVHRWETGEQVIPRPASIILGHIQVAAHAPENPTTAQIPDEAA